MLEQQKIVLVDFEQMVERQKMVSADPKQVLLEPDPMLLLLLLKLEHFPIVLQLKQQKMVSVDPKQVLLLLLLELDPRQVLLLLLIVLEQELESFGQTVEEALAMVAKSAGHQPLVAKWPVYLHLELFLSSLFFSSFCHVRILCN